MLMADSRVKPQLRKVGEELGCPFKVRELGRPKRRMYRPQLPF